MQSTKTKHLKIGSAGEYLTMFEIYMEGYKALHSSGQSKYDIIIDTGSRMIKTQVKTTTKNTTAKHMQTFRYQICRRAGQKYLDPYEIDDFELYAFACIPLRRVAFIPHKDINTSYKVTIRLEEFDFYTLSRAIKILTV